MSKQKDYEARTRRALSIIRELAKQHGYRVGGHGGTQINAFMEVLETAVSNGEIVLLAKPEGRSGPDSG